MFRSCLPALKYNAYTLFLKDCVKSGVLAKKRNALSTASKLYRKLGEAEKQSLARRANRLNAAEAKVGGVAKPAAPGVKSMSKSAPSVATPIVTPLKKKIASPAPVLHQNTQAMNKVQLKTSAKTPGNAHKAIKKASVSANARPFM